MNESTRNKFEAALGECELHAEILGEALDYDRANPDFQSRLNQQMKRVESAPEDQESLDFIETVVDVGPA